MTAPTHWTGDKPWNRHWPPLWGGQAISVGAFFSVLILAWWRLLDTLGDRCD